MDHLYAPPFEDKSPDYPILGIMYSGTPYVLPCRPTHPRTSVVLRKTLSGTLVDVGGDITYDRKEGYKFHYPNVFYNGMFECIFSFNGTVTKLSAIITYKGKLFFLFCLFCCMVYQARFSLFSLGSDLCHIKVGLVQYRGFLPPKQWSSRGFEPTFLSSLI